MALATLKRSAPLKDDENVRKYQYNCRLGSLFLDTAQLKDPEGSDDLIPERIRLWFVCFCYKNLDTY